MEKLKLITAKTLETKSIPLTNWAIDGIIPEGLSILAGAPKSGKSLLALSMALAIASGTEIIGKKNQSIKNVLFLPYEDSERRLQERIKKISLGLSIEKNERVFFIEEGQIPRLDKNNLNWLKELKDENKIDVIIIDTLGSSIKGIKNKNISTYLDEYDLLNYFQRFAIDNKISLIFLHHTRKMKADNIFDEISGTRAISGAADANLILQRNKYFGSLHIQGRDIEDVQYDLELDKETLTWTCKETSNPVSLSPEQKSILDVFNQDYEKELKPSQIAELLGKENQNIRPSFKKLISLGLLHQDSYGKYKLAYVN